MPETNNEVTNGSATGTVIQNEPIAPTHYDPMQSSILNDIKKMLGPSETYNHFDIDIILSINSVFNTLKQLGVGPQNGFEITGPSETWADFWQDTKVIPMVKSYMFMKVKMIFDPPTSSIVANSYTEMIKEFEWRAYIEADHKGDWPNNPISLHVDPETGTLYTQRGLKSSGVDVDFKVNDQGYLEVTIP